MHAAYSTTPNIIGSSPAPNCILKTQIASVHQVLFSVECQASDGYPRRQFRISHQALRCGMRRGIDGVVYKLGRLVEFVGEDKCEIRMMRNDLFALNRVTSGGQSKRWVSMWSNRMWR
jgi:hypothetical protein